jgi:short subunit dehydrogenase-like uncharacterized protein
MDDVARRAGVVCTTVGPYARHGEPLVAACAEHGTSYCDLTGEVPWIRAMIDAHHARAAATGARIVHCCGFDSVPSDLGVLLVHEHLAALGKQLREAHLRVVRMKGGVSGGTAASLLGVLEAASDPPVRRLLADAYSLVPEGPRGADGLDQLAPKREDGRWTGPFVMAAVNTRIVRRTNALLGYPYGRDFRYDEAIDTGRGATGLATAAALTAGLGALAAVGSVAAGRRLIARFLPSPGEGPSREERERGGFVIEVRATATDGTRATAVVEGRRDPGYGGTARMLGESALCLAEDALPPRAGVLTPASAMGDALVRRLRAVGMTLEAR